MAKPHVASYNVPDVQEPGIALGTATHVRKSTSEEYEWSLVLF